MTAVVVHLLTSEKVVSRSEEVDCCCCLTAQKRRSCEYLHQRQQWYRMVNVGRVVLVVIKRLIIFGDRREHQRTITGLTLRTGLFFRKARQ